MMHRYATALLLFTLPAQAHEHPKDFAGGNGEWFDQLERPDNAQHPERYRTGGRHLCCTDKDATAVQTKYQIPEGGSYPEAVWYVRIRIWTYTGYQIDWVKVPPHVIIHERPSGIDDDPAMRNKAWVFLTAAGTMIMCFIPPLPEN